MHPSPERALFQLLPQGSNQPPTRVDVPPALRRHAESPRGPSDSWLDDLDDTELRAVRTLVHWWPSVPPRSQSRSILSVLLPTPLLVLQGEAALIDAGRLCEIAAGLDEDASWLAGQGGLSPESLAALRCRATFPEGDWPATLPTSRPLVRALVRSLATRAAPRDRTALAEALRGHWLTLHGPSLAAIRTDEAWLSDAGTSSDPHLSTRTQADAIAAAPAAGWADRLASRYPAAAASRAAPVSRSEALRRLLESVRPSSADPPLVPPPFADGEDPDWTVPASMAVVSDLEARLSRLIPTRDWAAFEAPWEGELPSLWRDALVIAGNWSPTWADRMAAFDLDPLESSDPCDVLLGYAERRAARDVSPLSSYSHGLHDGTAECYGGVHSARDPFSDRGRAS